MSFGLCNVLVTFQRIMISIFSYFLKDIMDSFSVYGCSFDECLLNLEKLLERCVKVNLVLNWKKCHFMVKDGIILVHLVFERGIEIDKANIEVIEKLNPLSIMREVNSFLGHAEFYRHSIKYFSKISKPLTGLLIKDVEFKFNSECLKSFTTLKEALISTPIMQFLFF